jgi:hypothetical protein
VFGKWFWTWNERGGELLTWHTFYSVGILGDEKREINLKALQCFNASYSAFD